MNDNCLIIGKIIREKRIEKGLSTRDLGYLVGVSNAEISRIENGLKKDIGLNLFLTICKILEEDPVFVLDEANLVFYDDDKLFYVLFKGDEEQIFKINARSDGEALRFAFDFVMENNLLIKSKNKKELLVAVVDDLKKLNRNILDYYEKTGRFPDKDID